MMHLQRTIVGGLLLLLTTAVQAQAVPFADLARHNQYQDVKISPDGAYLAATALVRGHSVLALIHLADNKVQLVHPRDEDVVTDFWWASPPAWCTR